jgi:hypothetical protein
MILRALENDNDQLDTPDRVTIDSIRNHTKRHFPVQNVAKATYRAILERRAQENGVDFINGVATAITPMAFFETVMVKGYETLVDPETRVDVSTGMIAAARLQALIDSRAGKTSMAEILYKMDRIINAIHDTVPPELWEVILRKIDGPMAADSPMGESEDCDDAEDEYGPVDSGVADEAGWTAPAERDSPVEGRRAPSRTIEAPPPVIREFTPKTVKGENCLLTTGEHGMFDTRSGSGALPPEYANKPDARSNKQRRPESWEAVMCRFSHRRLRGQVLGRT